MDLADRYLNAKSAIYLLRCGEHEKAKATVGLFTKVLNFKKQKKRKKINFFKILGRRRPFSWRVSSPDN